MTSQSNKVGLFGKHPDAGDFLRLNASSTLVKAFDQWLSNSFDQASRNVVNWSWTYQHLAPFGFVFRTSVGGASDSCLVGCIAPSQDQSGRRFPLTIFAEISQSLVDASYPVIPRLRFVLEAFAVIARRYEHDRNSLVEAVEALKPPTPADIERAETDHKAFLAATRADFEIPGMFGGSYNLADKSLGTLAALVKDAKSDLPQYAIRCPVFRTRPVEHAGYWISALQHLLPIRLLPSLLWSGDVVVMHLNSPINPLLSYICDPTHSDDYLCDLREVVLGTERPIQPGQSLAQTLGPTD